jgi:hypothetical protein
MQVKNSLAGLLLGIATGAIGVILIQRLQQVLREEDVEGLRERLADQLSSLEQGLVGS